MTDVTDVSSNQLKEHLELGGAQSNSSIATTGTSDEVYKELPANNTQLLTVFLLVSTMIGSGILNMPMVFKKAGIFGSFIAFAICSYSTWLGMVLTTQTAIDTKILDLAALVKNIFHEKGERLMAAAIFVGNFGAIMSYITIVGGITSDLLERWKCDNVDGGCGFYTWSILLMYLVEFPLVLRRYYGHLAVLSVFSITTIVLCLCFVLFGGSAFNKQYRHDEVNLFSIAGVISQFGSITYSMSCNSSSIYAFTSLKQEEQTVETWRSTAFYAIVSGVGMLVLMGMSGYLYMRSGVDGDIMESFDTTAADPFKLMLVVHILLYIPIDFIIMRNMFLVACKIPENTPFPLHFVLTFMILSTAVIIVMLMYYGGVSNGTAFNYIVGLTGSVALSFISFLVPAALYLKIRNMPYMVVLKYLGFQPTKSPTDSSSSYSNEFVTHAQYLFSFGCFVMVAVPTTIFVYGA